MVEKLREAVLKVKAGYESQMKFCDVEPLVYFREFVRRLDAALATASPSVVADKPDAGEVAQEDRRFVDEMDDALGFLTERERPILLKAIASYRHAAHEAGKREGREEAAKVADRAWKIANASTFRLGDPEIEARRDASLAASGSIATAIRALSQQETK